MASLENKVIVISGGSGVIGTSLVYRLLEENIKEIIIIDNLSSSQKQFLPIDNRISFKYGDITNFEKLVGLVPKETDYIFHLAAHFANQKSVDYPLSDIQSNIIGTVNLLNLSKKLNLKKFINCSSSCVYGDVSEMVESNHVFPNETPYAINKFTTELYTSYYAKQFNVSTINIRLFNTYGSYEMAGQYRNVIPKFIDCALRNISLTITGTGEETRDFTYAADTCELFILAAVSEKRYGEVYNGGTGISTSIIEIAEKIISISRSKSEIKFIPKRDWDDIQHRKANIDKSKKDLGYYPKHLDLKENLRNVVEWYKTQIESGKNYAK